MFKEISHTLKRLRLSIQKNAAVQTADVICLKETAVVGTANENSIQLLKRLLSIHTKLISRLIGQVKTAKNFALKLFSAAL